MKNASPFSIFAGHAESPPSRSAGRFLDLAVLVLGGSALLIAIILWFDNAQGGLTGNGVFKSIELKPWVVDPASAKLYPSNYLFYPVYGALCRVLDLLGVFAGDPRRQITVLNAISASLCLCAVYTMTRALIASRTIALISALFHIACSYVLFLAITNEDIMPSYTLMFTSMALAGVWFAKPSASRVVVVSVVFSLGWLFEWRLMFPTLPAMLAALWLCEARPTYRLVWIGLFLATLVATASAIALAWHGHAGAVGPFDLIWTGKAVGSTWSGFSWAKLANLPDGMAGYVLGTAITNFPSLPGWDMWRVAGLLMIFFLLFIASRMLWRERHDSRARAVAVVFSGTLVAGQVFNLYSQPQDPQMQINVMACLTPAWSLAILAAYRRWGVRGLSIGTGLATVLLAHNVWSLAPLRGQDTAWKNAIAHIERQAAPERTVFIIHDFDWTVVYASLHWGFALPGIETLPAAPQASPRLKWIGFASQILEFPDWTEDEHAAGLKRQIDRAFALGYDVFIVRLWERSESELEAMTGTIQNNRHSRAMGRMLHREYGGQFAFEDPLAGRFYRLTRAH